MFGCVQRLTVIIVHFDWEHDDLISGFSVYLRVPRVGISWTIFSHSVTTFFHLSVAVFEYIIIIIIIGIIIITIIAY